MMKTIYLLMIGVLLLGNAWGQKIRFTDTSNRWRMIKNDASLPSVYSFQYLQYADTVISQDAYEYQLLGNFLIREDTVSNIVYAKAYNMDIGDRADLHVGQGVYDTSEFVLFNYNRTIGDVFYLPTGNYYSTYSKHTIVGMSSVVIRGQLHRVFAIGYEGYLADGTPDYNGEYIASGYCIIEGIGAYTEPVSPRPDSSYERNMHINCFINNGDTVLIDEDYIRIDCAALPTSINNLHLFDQHLKVYPNPAQEIVSIYMPYDKQQYTIRIVDIAGRELYTSRFFEQHQVNTSAFSKGIYLIIVAGSKGIGAFRKLVVE